MKLVLGHYVYILEVEIVYCHIEAVGSHYQKICVRDYIIGSYIFYEGNKISDWISFINLIKVKKSHQIRFISNAIEIKGWGYSVILKSHSAKRCLFCVVYFAFGCGANIEKVHIWVSHSSESGK